MKLLGGPLGRRILHLALSSAENKRPASGFCA
jgi:hypothetical protein